MSDDHNPMRPLFVEVPSVADDLRGIFEGIAAAAVEAAKPPPPRQRTVLDMAADALSSRLVMRHIGASAVESRLAPLDLVMLVRARCSTCDRWVNVAIDERAIVLAPGGNRGGVEYALEQLVGAMDQHVCDLVLG